MIHDGNDIGQALSGPGSRRQDVVAAGFRRLYGIGLMSVQSEGAAFIGFFGLDAKDFSAFGMKDASGNKPLDPFAGFKSRVKLNERIGPEQTFC
ncbi:MAG: hypothetical protein KJ663_05050 [Proteobacteria bacterium]|nr:hypothetical protein [Pseudomonadota bacterium]